MKKNVVQDVIPPKKSIRNVILPSRSGAGSEAKPVIKEKSHTLKTSAEGDKFPPTGDTSYKYEYDEPKSSRKFLYISVFVFLVVLAFGISAFFKSAKVTITPKSETKLITDTFTAKKDITTGGLGFQTVTSSKDIEKTVEATGEEKVDKKAQGKIVIYNNYNSQPQKLVATTRFQTPEGLIFRLVSAVTVPGRQISAGKTVAGNVEATVEADKSGSEYNIGLKDFTIPGFKGDPKFTKIYGRSKTEMSGGFSGMQKVVSKETISAANTEMQESLKVALSKEIESSIPANFVFYPASLSFKFDPAVQAGSGAGGATLRKKASASAIIFDKGLLSRAILAKTLPQSVDELIKITNLEGLEFTYTNPPDLNCATSITFTLRGNAIFVWVLDENKVKSDLLGLSKKEAKTAISKYPVIKEAWVETYPFWNQTIPSNPGKVTLINTLSR